MNKINFINELCTISDNPITNKQNFDVAMMRFDKWINLFYEALKNISEMYDAHGEIIVSPVDFGKYEVPPAYFKFRFSKKVTKVIDCATEIPFSEGICNVCPNEEEAGYIASINIR